jgi:hypothetical protein
MPTGLLPSARHTEYIVYIKKKSDIFSIRIGRIRRGVSHPHTMPTLVDAPASPRRPTAPNAAPSAAPRVRLAIPAPVPRANPAAPTALLPAPPDDADRRRQCKEKRWALAWKPSCLTSCYVSGALMQTAKEAASGYDACFKCTIQMF